MTFLWSCASLNASGHNSVSGLASRNRHGHTGKERKGDLGSVNEWGKDRGVNGVGLGEGVGGGVVEG